MSDFNKKILVKDLENTPYQKAWDFQEKLLKQIVDLKIANRKSCSNRPKDQDQCQGKPR